MTPKTLVVAAAVVVAATAAALAQDYGYYRAPHGWANGSYYDYAPSYYGFGYAPYSGPGYYESDIGRGGPGPRVGPGTGMGIGSQR
ncbi:MAG TPA: hypothetical protein VEK75_18090 [Xanthobacteraceae bacterium]|nr:hypothetical protein [Xanthobacteraceae bacterium]